MSNIIKDVTIIIPVYNEEKFVKKAILCAVKQAEFIIISDNNSTDSTQKICNEMAREYPNIQFFTQKENIGSIKNFEFIFSKIKTKYFIHIGAHDFIPNGYVQQLKNTLENNPNGVLAYSPYASIDENDTIINEYTLNTLNQQLTSEISADRVLAIIENPEYVYIIFGIFITDIFRKCADFVTLPGFDRIILSKIAVYGKFIYVPSTKFYWRILSREETEEAYMKRITGIKKDFNINYLKKVQLETLQNCCSIDTQKNYIKRANIFFDTRYARENIEYDIKSIKKLSKKEKYILYGAGSDSYIFINNIKENILFIVDIDERQHGKLKNGIKVLHPSSIENYNNKIILTPIGRTEEIKHYISSKFKIDMKRIISIQTKTK